MLIKNLVKSVEVAVKSGVVPFIQGSPGFNRINSGRSIPTSFSCDR